MKKEYNKLDIKWRLERRTIIQDDGHWIWIGYRNKEGHGRISINGKDHLTHRVARYVYCGMDLESKVNVNHKPECNNPSCINPDHTYEGNSQDNTIDLVKSGNHFQARKTHCPQGHEYTSDNTYIHSRESGRQCIKCRNERNLTYRLSNK